MKKRHIIIIAVFIIIIILAIVGYFYFSTKIKDFLNSKNPAASVANTYLNYRKGERDNFSFIIVSDSENKEGVTSSIFKKIIASANKSQAKFLIHLGDFTSQGTKLEYEEFKDYLDKNLTLPYYIAPGNHDISQDKEKKEIFKKYFGKLYYSFDFEKTHFIILDNSNNKYGFGDEQIKWLTNDLKENKGKQIFVFMHRPIDIPYAEKIDLSDGATKKATEGYQKFHELIKNYQVTEIFAGHVHIYFSYMLENTPVIITGGGGSEPNLPFWESLGNFTHYILATVRPDSYTTEIVEIK